MPSPILPRPGDPPPGRRLSRREALSPHNYQRFVSGGGVTYVVTAGGGQPLYPVDACATAAPRWVVAQVRHHFTAVEVHGATLAVTAVADDGAVIDRTVIRR